MFQGCLILIDLQDVHQFDSLILSNIFICNCLLVFWLATIKFIFSNQVLKFFVEILSFGFCLINSECSAYLAVDQSLLYKY